MIEKVIVYFIIRGNRRTKANNTYFKILNVPQTARGIPLLCFYGNVYLSKDNCSIISDGAEMPPS